MRSCLARRLAFACALLALPAAGYAQEAVLSGTVTDSTGAVLPGANIQAVHEASGNTFEAVTDPGGRFRIPARIGSYRITATLAGFTTVTRTGVELQVGQTLVLPIQMNLAQVAETVTVTGEAPLIDTTTSVMGGNIDQRQMQDLPVQGRDWTSLALLAPGNRTTEMGDTPVQDRADVREYHLNMDGQQVTQTMGIGGQPIYSRDSIAEFQFISNRFDATQGRSSGVLVNAVTKSGTNTLSGLFSGYFRDSDWNAADHILGRVVPFSEQQISSTVGGPILRDRFHFFGNYEYDRSPKTSIWNTPYTAFNVELNGKEAKKIGGLRLDYQLSPKTRLMLKGHLTSHVNPFGTGSSTEHPASADSEDRTSEEYLAQLTQVLSNRALNEVKVGYAGWTILEASLATWSNHPQRHNGITVGHPRIRLQGFTVAGNRNTPRIRSQNMYSLRDDFTLSYNARGRHDLKTGGEYLYMKELTRNCRNCGGEIDARGGAVPANIEAILPDPFKVDTWNLAAFSPITRQYTVGISDTFRTPFAVPRIAAWAQDDWHISPSLTLNLGLRYDLIKNGWANDVAIPPFLEGGRPDDTNNIQPRLGFAYQLNDRTVLRGGVGRYYGDILTNLQMWTLINETVATIQIPTDRRPDFAANPFNGPAPTAQQAFARFCDVNNVAGCLVRGLQELAPPPDYAEVQNSWQTSVGVARQVGNNLALEVDYVYNGSRNEKIIMDNVNLTYDAATGINYPFQNVSRRAFPLLGVVPMTPYTGWSNYHAVQTALTRRFTNNWQGSVTYTVGGLWNAESLPISGTKMVTFNVAPDLGNEYTLATTDQRHRVVLNGIWQVGYGFQVSGVYFYGSGERLATTYGADLRNLGADGSDRLRPDDKIIPRNNLVGDPVHRVDLRLQQRIPLRGRMSVDGIFEVFNLFDRANFGSYSTAESSRTYGQPEQNDNIAYGPRTLQMGFRFTF